MTERQPGRPAGETAGTAEPHEPGAGALSSQTMSAAADDRPPTYAGVERRAHPRRIDCSPDAPRAVGWGGRHR